MARSTLDTGSDATAPAVEPPPSPTAPGATFRRWTGLDEIPGMAAASGKLRARCGILEPIDVPAMRHHYANLEGSDPLTDCLLVEVDGRVVGYGRTEWHELTDGDRIYDATIVVEPDAWGRGIGASLLAWCEARARQLAVEHPTERRSWLAGWTFDGDDEGIGALAAAGYHASRTFAEMRRPDLEDLPEPRLADGYALRALTRDDLPAIWDLLNVAFDEHYGEYEQGEAGYREWAESPQQRPELHVAAVDATGAFAAVVLGILETLPDGSLRGLVDGVATHPAHRRRGLARACLVADLRVLRAHGATSAYLGVDLSNANAAPELYLSSGFVPASTSRAYRRSFTPDPSDRAPLASPTPPVEETRR